jgi:SAM-dependent methyltransferase
MKPQYDPQSSSTTVSAPETAAVAVGPNRIAAPRLIHFILLSHDAETELSLIAYVAIKSAKLRNPDFAILLHSNTQPVGIFWHRIAHLATLYPVVPPDSIFGEPVHRTEHKVDILRIQILLEHGGIYLDLDTVCLRPLDGFLRRRVVLGEESEWGVCNAVIAAPQGAAFLRIWHDGYLTFNNHQWNEFSGVLPARLAKAHPDLVDIEPRETFFWPGCEPDSLQDLFIRKKTFLHASIYHLWNYAAQGYIAGISLRSIYRTETTFNMVAREVIGDDREALWQEALTSIHVSPDFVREVALERDVFRQIYATSAWGRGSGNGSHPAATAEYRNFLERFIVMNDITSIVDVGCGDWQSSRYTSFGNATYTGLDVVESLIETNTANFGSDAVDFRLMPDDPRDLPTAQLILMKDVLQHLTDSQIIFYRDHVFPRYPYCLITNSWRAIKYPQNVPILPGQFRSLDLNAAPYFFGGAYVVESWNEWERIRTMLLLGHETLAETVDDVTPPAAGPPAAEIYPVANVTPASVTINFDADGSSDDYVGAGWSGRESRMRWTDGSNAVLRVSGLTPGFKYACEISVYPFVMPPDLSEQHVQIFCAGSLLLDARVTSATVLKVDIPKAGISVFGVANLDFWLPYACSPAERGFSGDVRKLGLAVSLATFHPAG